MSMPVSASVFRSLFLRGVFWAGLALVVGLIAWLMWPTAIVPVTPTQRATSLQDDATVERGRYLATLGNCQGCHTVPGQAPYAGGTPITTPFGTVYGSNLTPSPTGLADWTPDGFWRALHQGQSADGRWLNPAFPFTHTTHIRREDSDAMFAYLQSLPPSDTPNRPHDLRWPYGTQSALKVWRALYFTPGTAPAVAADEDEIGRGRYLAEGLAHCSACHTPRTRWGGLVETRHLSGAAMPSGWYAPSLLDPREGGVQDWAREDVLALLGQGKAQHHATVGPMAEVVASSLSQWSAADLQAMTAYLMSLPVASASASRTPPSAPVDLSVGARLYEQHCLACHGADGMGFTLASGQVAYPRLAGNRAVTLSSPANLVRIVQEGGFGLPSAQHPQPFGMPPYQQVLDDASMAALLTYIRQSWGNTGAGVEALDVHHLRNR